MNYEFFELIMTIIGTVVIIFFVCGIVGGGLSLICRPLDHQFEWEKRAQGLNRKNRELEAAKRQGGTE